MQNGYIVGALTYLPVGELALVLRPAFSDRLAAAGSTPLQTLLANPGASAEALEATVGAPAGGLGIEPLTRALKRRPTRPRAGPARAAGRPA